MNDEIVSRFFAAILIFLRKHNKNMKKVKRLVCNFLLAIILFAWVGEQCIIVTKEGFNLLFGDDEEFDDDGNDNGNGSGDIDCPAAKLAPSNNLDITIPPNSTEVIKITGLTQETTVKINSHDAVFIEPLNPTIDSNGEAAFSITVFRFPGDTADIEVTINIKQATKECADLTLAVNIDCANQTRTLPSLPFPIVLPNQVGYNIAPIASIDVDNLPDLNASSDDEHVVKIVDETFVQTFSGPEIFVGLDPQGVGAASVMIVYEDLFGCPVKDIFLVNVECPLRPVPTLAFVQQWSGATTTINQVLTVIEPVANDKINVSQNADSSVAVVNSAAANLNGNEITIELKLIGLGGPELIKLEYSDEYGCPVEVILEVEVVCPFLDITPATLGGFVDEEISSQLTVVGLNANYAIENAVVDDEFIELIAFDTPADDIVNLTLKLKKTVNAEVDLIFYDGACRQSIPVIVKLDTPS